MEQPKLVAELVTGMKFPLSMEMPPFQVTPYQGHRPGYVYKMGPKGVGYYPDAYRGGNTYVPAETEAKQQHLIGIGMRCMLQKCEFALAQAYAIGLYIDESFVEDGSQAQGRHLDARPLEDPRVRKTFRLVMAREVKGPHIAKGFDRTLINVLRRMTNSKKSPGKDALKKFTGIFSSCGTLQQNDDVMLYMPGDGSLTIFIKGVRSLPSYSLLYDTECSLLPPLHSPVLLFLFVPCGLLLVLLPPCPTNRSLVEG